MQFVTAESLEEESVLFTNPQNVQDLRKWVAAEGSFDSLSGRRLRRTMNTLIRGKPIHSHLAERLVHLGNTLKIRGAHNESKERVAAKFVLLRTARKTTGKPLWMNLRRATLITSKRTRSRQYTGGMYLRVLSVISTVEQTSETRPSSRCQFAALLLGQRLLSKLKIRPLLVLRRTKLRARIERGLMTR